MCSWLSTVDKIVHSTRWRVACCSAKSWSWPRLIYPDSQSLEIPMSPTLLTPRLEGSSRRMLFRTLFIKSLFNDGPMLSWNCVCTEKDSGPGFGSFGLQYRMASNRSTLSPGGQILWPSSLRGDEKNAQSFSSPSFRASQITTGPSPVSSSSPPPSCSKSEQNDAHTALHPEDGPISARYQSSTVVEADRLAVRVHSGSPRSKPANE